jgi:hypothetical protein
VSPYSTYCSYYMCTLRSIKTKCNHAMAEKPDPLSERKLS